MPLSVAAACNSKLKVRQKRLRSASPQARLILRSERRVQDQLHAAGFVEEALGDDGVGRGQGAERRHAGLDVGDGLPGGGFVQAEHQAEACATSLTALTARGQFYRSARRFAQPERKRWLRAVRIFHAHFSLAYVPDAPRVRPQQKYVAGQALDREVLIDGADHLALGLDNHGIRRAFRNRAARSDRGEFRAASAAQPVIHLIAMQQRAAAAARSCDAFRKHRHYCFVVAQRQIAVRIRGADQIVEFGFAPVLARRLCDNLLRHDVQRVLRDFDALQIAAANRVNDRRAFDQLVARRREQDAARPRADPMSGAPDTLESDRNRTRRPDLNGQIHGSDIDAQFERRRSHHCAQFAILQPRFGILPKRSRQTSVVRQNGVGAEARSQRMRDAFRQPPRVDEDQRRALAENVPRQAIVDLLPHLAGRDRAKFVVGDLDREVHFAAMADVDDAGVRGQDRPPLPR